MELSYNMFSFQCFKVIGEHVKTGKHPCSLHRPRLQSLRFDRSSCLDGEAVKVTKCFDYTSFAYEAIREMFE